MSLRVIGGQWRGRRLEAPPGRTTRPLTDRIKQSLFDWLGQSFDGYRVVDVCAGSGGFGIEAASRGAAEVALVESDRSAQRTITQNLASLGQPRSVRLCPGRFQDILPTCSGIDLVFADPPFPWFGEQPDLLIALMEAAAGCLGPEGVVVIRGERGTDLPASDAPLDLVERRDYGRSWVSAWRRREAQR